MSVSNIVMRMSAISKTFPGVKALSEVDFELKKGEVHALCGENGAGKSTLMNILAGVIQADNGEIYIDNQRVNFRSLRHSSQLGISIVFQERSVVQNLSVAENIFTGEDSSNKIGYVNRRKLNKKACELLSKFSMDIEPNTQVGSLSPSQQQMVEIAKAVSKNAKICIFDEPTAAITYRETKILFDVIKKLQAEGISIIYISHRLSEIKEICDRVTVLKDGKKIGTREVKDVSIDEIVCMMVGRELVGAFEYKKRKPLSEVILDIQHLSGKGFEDVSFQLHKGEIVTFAGLIGAGRTELALAILGYVPYTSGDLYLCGKRVRFKTTAQAIANGIGYMTEDRKDLGLFLEMSIKENIVAGNMKAYSKGPIVNERKIKTCALKYKKELSIAAPGLDSIVMSLSGGNQQKVILGRLLLTKSRVLIVDEPTRGIDVGTKAEFYEILRNIADDGVSIIVISSELPEVFALGDRIIVMADKKITGIIDRADSTEEKIIKLASKYNN